MGWWQKQLHTIGPYKEGQGRANCRQWAPGGSSSYSCSRCPEPVLCDQPLLCAYSPTTSQPAGASALLLPPGEGDVIRRRERGAWAPHGHRELLLPTPTTTTPGACCCAYLPLLLLPLLLRPPETPGILACRHAVCTRCARPLLARDPLLNARPSGEWRAPCRNMRGDRRQGRREGPGSTRKRLCKAWGPK